MTVLRGFKLVNNAVRGAKVVASAAKRGANFLAKHNIKNLNVVDNLANNIAQDMHTAGQYAALGSHLAPGQYHRWLIPVFLSRAHALLEKYVHMGLGDYSGCNRTHH